MTRLLTVVLVVLLGACAQPVPTSETEEKTRVRETKAEGTGIVTEVTVPGRYVNLIVWVDDSFRERHGWFEKNVRFDTMVEDGVISIKRVLYVFPNRRKSGVVEYAELPDGHELKKLWLGRLRDFLVEFNQWRSLS